MIMIHNLSIEVGVSLFWSLRDDNRPHQSVSSGVPIKPYIIYVLRWAFVRLMLRVRWANVGSMLGPSMLGLCWAHVGPKFNNLADFRSL
jgi:hypothetical protein